MVKSTNEILSEILNIITSGLPLPEIKVQLEDIINNQNLSKNLQEQILQYVKETLTDIKTNQIISTDYQARLNHQTLAIKEDTDTIAHLMQTQK